MDIEAILLTGGASRRMGEDKAKLLIEGVPQAERIVAALQSIQIPTTILGREPVRGCAFIADEDEFAGPLAAVGRFTPTKEFVFISFCDLPRFDVRLVQVLRDRIGDADASAPFVDGFRQPLTALYRASSLARIPDILDMEGACPMLWLRNLNHVLVSEDELIAAGIDPSCTRGANTKEELRQLGVQ